MDSGNYSGKHVFLSGNDALATTVNDKANELYHLLTTVDVHTFNITATYKQYFVNHHLGKRLFFSLQNSAHIIYHSVKKTAKPINEISFMDYGAGLGTLFMLGGMMGFRRMVYNDYFPEWQQSAQSVCQVMNIQIDHYVIGDIDAVTVHAATNKIQYDIIASRNVIEHIYSLPHFYAALHRINPGAVIWSTTTANYHNPVMRWYHVYVHNKWEKSHYRQERMNAIKELLPSLSIDRLHAFTTATRGKGQQDFIDAVNLLAAGREISIDPSLRSNTCNHITGVWNEHLLTKKEYASIINNAGFKMEYTPGYWDTHYRYVLINWIAKLLNKIILLLGKKGIVLSPFVNVTAYN